MDSLKIILFFISVQKIYLISDYCTSRASPTQPNDCVFLSNDTNKCCFNPSNNTQCFWESSEEGLLCDANYFYNYMIGENYYKQYKNKNGYCTFVYGEMKGAFEYKKIIENSLNIKEFNGLIINCLSEQDIIKMKLLTFIFAFILIF